MSMIPKHPVLTLLLVLILGYTGMHLFYYEHTGSPELLAQKLVAQNREPDGCFLFRTFDIWFRPTTYELQMRCVREYASLTKDPTACELLLPSDYGWSCVGAAREKGGPCTIDYGRSVMWSDTPSPYDQPEKATLVECGSGLLKSETGKKCCYLLEMTSELGLNNCSRFEGDTSFQDHERKLSLHDQCLSILATKLQQEKLCEDISDENAQTICKIRVKYL